MIGDIVWLALSMKMGTLSSEWYHPYFIYLEHVTHFQKVLDVVIRIFICQSIKLRILLNHLDERQLELINVSYKGPPIDAWLSTKDGRSCKSERVLCYSSYSTILSNSSTLINFRLMLLLLSNPSMESTLNLKIPFNQWLWVPSSHKLSLKQGKRKVRTIREIE